MTHSPPVNANITRPPSSANYNQAGHPPPGVNHNQMGRPPPAVNHNQMGPYSPAVSLNQMGPSPPAVNLNQMGPPPTAVNHNQAARPSLAANLNQVGLQPPMHANHNQMRMPQSPAGHPSQVYINQVNPSPPPANFMNLEDRHNYSSWNHTLPTHMNNPWLDRHMYTQALHNNSIYGYY